MNNTEQPESLLEVQKNNLKKKPLKWSLDVTEMLDFDCHIFREKRISQKLCSAEPQEKLLGEGSQMGLDLFLKSD